MDHFYNTRSPTPEESRLIVGTGEVMQVKCIGDLDMVLHCDEDVVVTLREVSFVPGLWYELMSFNIIQETENIVLNKTGAHMLRGQVHFDKEKNGNYVQATRVARGSRGPPAMVAAVMRPGRQRSMNINDMHYSLGHANDATLRETAIQLRLKLTGHRQYCSDCGEAKAIRAAVPKTTSFRVARPLERLFGDLTGPFSPSADGARYCMLLVDDYSNVGWVLFVKDKTGSTVTQAFRAFFAAIKPLITVHGPVGSLHTDNGLEFVNDDFKNRLTELNIKRELTPVDGAKRNGRVEQKLALITEGAKAAWLEFPRHFPDLQFPRKALIWDKIWPEAFSWMNDCINISARVDDKPDMLCPWEKLYGRRPTSLVLPFMMPGFRHANRKTKMHSNGERCFYLNTGLGRWSISERGRSSNSGRRRIQWKPGSGLGRWSISEHGRSSNSGRRRIQWEPGSGLGRWSISERGRSSNSGRRRIQWEPGSGLGRWSISERGCSSNSGRRRFQWEPGSGLGRCSISEHGRSSNSGRRRIQWEPGSGLGRWSISERGRSSNSGRRRIQWEPGSGQGRRRHSNSGSRHSKSWNRRC